MIPGGGAGAVRFRSAGEIDAAIPRAVEHLRAGRILAHPTETVYGLGCQLAPPALEELRELKGREEDKPFVVLIGGTAALEKLGVRLTGAGATLAEAFWPGALTLVVPSRHDLPSGVQRQDGAVAVRWTSHEGVARLIRALDAPMTSTSANRSGLPTATAAPEIVREWADEVRRERLLVLDGGPAATGTPPSTIVDCTGEAPYIARPGAIRNAALRNVVHGLGGED